MKPISATKSNICDHCEAVKVMNLVGKEESRYMCDLDITDKTYKQPCTMRDWMICDKNEDK